MKSQFLNVVVNINMNRLKYIPNTDNPSYTQCTTYVRTSFKCFVKVNRHKSIHFFFFVNCEFHCGDELRKKSLSTKPCRRGRSVSDHVITSHDETLLSLFWAVAIVRRYRLSDGGEVIESAFCRFLNFWNLILYNKHKLLKDTIWPI